MTNEQLALYLRSLASNLKGLAHEINGLITEGEREIIPVWTGEGEPEFSISSLGLRHHYELPDGWERRPEGEFRAVIRIRDFAHWLSIEAAGLERKNES